MSFIRNILTEAADTVDQRAAERDMKQERSMAATVTAFNAIFGHNLTESQGWAFMAILKQARSARGPYKSDHYVDGAAYTALQAEARKTEWELEKASQSMDQELQRQFLETEAQFRSAKVETGMNTLAASTREAKTVTKPSSPGSVNGTV